MSAKNPSLFTYGFLDPKGNPVFDTQDVCESRMEAAYSLDMYGIPFWMKDEKLRIFEFQLVKSTKYVPDPYVSE